MWFFNKFITKDLSAVETDRRLFEGYLTVQMVDKQNEITVVDELMKVLPIWMARGGPISDTHTNRIVGKGINYQKTTFTDEDGTVYPAIFIEGEIHKDYELDHEIWGKIKSGEYRGLSFGGSTKSDRIPVQRADGSVAYSLWDLEHYEVAVCEDPAVPLALITQSNNVAKAMTPNTTDRGNGQMCIRCDKFGCYIEKAVEGVEGGDQWSSDPDVDRHHEKDRILNQVNPSSGSGGDFNRGTDKGTPLVGQISPKPNVGEGSGLGDNEKKSEEEDDKDKAIPQAGDYSMCI